MGRFSRSVIAPLSVLGLLVASPAMGDDPFEAEHRRAAAVPEPDALSSVQPYTPHAPPEDESLDPAPLQPDETPLTQPAPPSESQTQPSVGEPYPVIVNERVEYFLERFQTPRHRAVIGLWLNRSGRYLEMIRAVFRSHGLPEELAYVAMIESGFNPLAVSRAGAKGLWQFMAPTARRYGLQVDRWVDERLDPEKSTVAAARYLRDLFEQFGSWFLAKAAYNAGELKVARAIVRSGTTDFWSLTRSRILREETKRFVPSILAAMVIGQNPERYGFEITPEPPLAYDVVTVPSMLQLKRLATRTGTPPQDLQRLNPELRRGVTPPGGPYSLKVPSGSAPDVEQALAELVPSPGTVHVVKPGDTVGEIAQRYGVSVADVVRWNALPNAARIFPGERLRIAASK